MKYLIVDLNIELNGHKFGFVDQLLKYINEHELSSHEFTFLTNPVTSTLRPSSKAKVLVANESTWKHKQGITKYAEQWKLICTTAQNQQVESVILMEFDIYQAALGKKRMLPFQVSGIWFRPFVRQQNFSKSTKGKISFLLQQRKKRSLFAWSMRNQSIRNVYILNDQKTVDQLNLKYQGRMAYLADPVFDMECAEEIDIRKRYNIPANNFIFLLFGCIDERKNAENAIKAIEQLPHKSTQNLSLIIAGKVMPHYKALLQKHLEKSNSLTYQLVIKDDFVSDCEMEALFRHCDLSLRMNVNFFGSSGIIGLAAKYNKASLVSNYGIVAELTSEYQLGQVVDPMDVDAISQAYSHFLSGHSPLTIDGQEYYKNHNLDTFAETLLDL